MKKILISMIILLLFQKCTLANAKRDKSIVKQELIYDSLYNNLKIFNVSLRTKLQFKKNSINRKEYNDFFILIKKDTFPLVPEINNPKKISKSDKIEINYIAQINFKSREYDNDSLSNIIKNSSRIITSEGLEIIKNDSYFFNSLIIFHNLKKDGRVYE